MPGQGGEYPSTIDQTRAAFLDEITRLFNSTLDLTTVLQQVARMATRVLGDSCTIEHAHLFAFERQRGHHLQPIMEINREITRELDLTTLLELIVQRAMEPAGAATGATYLWDESAQSLSPGSWHGLGEWMRDLRLGLGEGVVGVVAQRREGLIVNDYLTSPYRHPLFAECLSITAALAEPLLYRGQLLGVINDILDFSKIEAGKLDLEPVDLHLHDSLAHTLKALALRAEQKGLELAYHVHPDVPDALIAGPGRLSQILVNLVSNAIKFTEQGKVMVHVEMAAQTEGLVYLHVAVTDTGIGIPAEKKQLIFNPFTQADGSTTRRYGGTGLGLTISARLVELMGGRIWVESEVGQGSTFHFTAWLGLQHGVVTTSLPTEVGVAAHLTKPFTQSALWDTILAALGPLAPDAELAPPLTRPMSRESRPSASSESPLGGHRAIGTGDAQQTEHIAHRLKGAVGNFGAKTAHTLAYELETMGRAANLNGASTILHHLEHELQRITAFFAEPGWEDGT